MNWSSASKASLTYVLLGTCWIILSDPATRAFSPAINMQTLSGLTFIGVTSLVIYWQLLRYQTAQGKQQAIKALQESEEKFRTLVDGAPDGIFVQLDGRFDYVNEAYLKLIGAHSAGQVVGTRVVDRVHPDHQARVSERIERLNKEHRPVELAELAHVKLDGERVPVEVTAVPFTQGDRTGGLVFVREITRRIEANKERQRLFQGIEHVSDGIVITDADGRIEYVNPAFEQASGYSQQEAIGADASIQRSGVHDESFYEDIWATIRKGEAWRNQIVNRRKDGSHYTEEVSITPVYDATGAIINYVSVQRDVTRELNLRNQLNHAQKMETVGRLAGGVAHDFNNMLSIILGSSEMLLSTPDITESMREDLSEIRLAAQKSGDLTRQLLTFARKQTITPAVFDLRETVCTLLRMLDRLVGEHIELRCNPDGDPCLVNMDPTQVDQILANLVVNARDAIVSSGEIVIDASNITLDDNDCIDKPGLNAGQYALLTVTDNGAGMSENVLSQIFEPFFTTKSDGTGTGLGLATVYSIVKQNNGYIEAYSREGEGTRFNIYLPGCGTVPGDTSESDVLSKRPSAIETILLVEDEASLLSLAERMLQKLDYTVFATTSPTKAIELMRQHTERIDLLLTDLSMPEMNGRELYEEIHKINPNIKVLFTSGYADQERDIHRNVDYGSSAFIQKPYSSGTLAAKLRESLKNGPEAGN